MKNKLHKHNRHSIRLKSYDYSQFGAYFVTICVKDRRFYFEKYPKLKEIVEKQWLDIPNRFQGIELYEYTIMPNHFHGIIFIKNSVGATLAVAQNNVIAPNNIRAGARPAPTVGEIVGSFKSLCINDWLKYIKENNINETGKFWQRNYYEHIVRDEKDFNEIREYIIYNYLKWNDDIENPKNVIKC